MLSLKHCDERNRHFGFILNWLRDPLAPQEAPDDPGFMHELDYFGLREAFVGPQSPRIYAFGGDDLKGKPR